MLVAPYKRLQSTKKTVNARRINKERMRYKLMRASFVDAPRLVKGFHNNPRITA